MAAVAVGYGEGAARAPVEVLAKTPKDTAQVQA